MSTTTYTEKDVVLREREAFVAGYACAHGAWLVDVRPAKSEAESRYPLPKVTRARVVRDPHDSTIEYRLTDGGYQYREKCGKWTNMDAIGETWSKDNCPTPERATLWADLIANPTEEVEE